jgi:CRP-like cAMP-binding protein
MQIDNVHFQAAAINCAKADQALSGLCQKYLDVMTANKKVLSVDSGAYITSGGPKPNNAYVLLSGPVRVLSADGCNARFDVRPGERPRMFGMLAMLADEDFHDELQALGRCEFVLITMEDLRQFLIKRPRASLFLIQTISRLYRDTLKTGRRGKLPREGETSHRRR